MKFTPELIEYVTKFIDGESKTHSREVMKAEKGLGTDRYMNVQLYQEMDKGTMTKLRRKGFGVEKQEQTAGPD